MGIHVKESFLKWLPLRQGNAGRGFTTAMCLFTHMELVDSLNYNSDIMKIFKKEKKERESKIAELGILFYFSGNTDHIKELFIIHDEFFERD